MTEVLSMGLELLYLDPAYFILAYPDHFTFLLRCLR